MLFEANAKGIRTALGTGDELIHTGSLPREWLFHKSPGQTSVKLVSADLFSRAEDVSRLM